MGIALRSFCLTLKQQRKINSMATFNQDIHEQDLRYQFTKFASATASGDELAVKRAIKSINNSRNTVKQIDTRQAKRRARRVHDIMSGYYL